MLLCLPEQSLAQVDTAAAENMLTEEVRFGRSLEGRGLYAEAALQYSHIRRRAAEAKNYYLLNDIMAGELNAQRLSGKTKYALALADTFLRFYQENNLEGADFTATERALWRVLFLDAAGTGRAQKMQQLPQFGRAINAALYPVAYYAAHAQWDSAAAILAALPPGPLPDNARRLQNITMQGQALKRKSVPLAIAMSTLLPGAGKVYAGRPAEGALAFAAVASVALPAYYGFRAYGTHSGLGWGFAGVAAILYAGNIYGSARAARLYYPLNTRLLKAQALKEAYAL